jgi:hypothetical protein
MDKLTLYSTIKPIYIAVCKHGFAIHDLPAMAIWRAHDHVPDDAAPTQLLLYEVPEGATDIGDEDPDVAPVGFKAGGPIWQNGHQPRLVGLTVTGRIFKQRPTFR